MKNELKNTNDLTLGQKIRYPLYLGVLLTLFFGAATFGFSALFASGTIGLLQAFGIGGIISSIITSTVVGIYALSDNLNAKKCQKKCETLIEESKTDASIDKVLSANINFYKNTYPKQFDKFYTKHSNKDSEQLK